MCELHNDTILEVVCTAGFDGGLAQHFLLEVVGGTPVYSSETTRSSTSDFDNEISTMNDQVSKHYKYIQNIPSHFLCQYTARLHNTRSECRAEGFSHLKFNKKNEYKGLMFLVL